MISIITKLEPFRKKVKEPFLYKAEQIHINNNLNNKPVEKIEFPKNDYSHWEWIKHDKGICNPELGDRFHQLGHNLDKFIEHSDILNIL